MVFRVWLSSQIGSEGMGLFQLVLSVYVLISTFGTTGICTAVSRMVADNESNGNAIKKIMNRSSLLILIISVITIVAVFILAPWISNYIICDSRAELPIKLLLIGLPFLALCSGIRGYFIGKRKAIIPSVGQIIEQIVRIIAVFILAIKAIPYGLEYACGAVVLGGGLGEIIEFIFVYLCYVFRKKETTGKKIPVTKELLRISLPITAGRYIHTALRTIENMLVPARLSLFSGSRTLALSQFGNLKGMAIPLLFFPASFLAAFSTMMIPEISSSMSAGHRVKVKTATEKSIGITIIVSVLIGGIFFICGRNISLLLYGSADTGVLLTCLSPLVPLMYLESVCDGILKGLDQQKHSFIYGVIDSISRIALIYFLCPIGGMKSFLLIMIYSNMLTSLLNLRRLIKITNIEINFRSWIINPLIAIIISGLVGYICMLNIVAILPKILVGVFITTSIYITIITLMGEAKIAQGIFK